MAKAKGPVKTCEECGASFRVPPSRAETARYCSRSCASRHINDGKGKSVTLVCFECGGEFQSPKSQAHRRTFCSYDCKHANRSYRNALSKGLRGERNAQWRGGVAFHGDGYVYRLAPDHPFSSNGYVLEHRLVMEQWLRNHDPKSEFLIELGLRSYLSPDCVVHHLDEDRKNNDPANLRCMTPAQHASIHAELRRSQTPEHPPPNDSHDE